MEEEIITKIQDDITSSFVDVFGKNSSIYKINMPTEAFAKQLLARIGVLKFLGKHPNLEIRAVLLDNPSADITKLVLAKLLLTHPLGLIDENVEDYIVEIEKQYGIFPSCAKTIQYHLKYYENDLNFIFQKLHIDIDKQKIYPPNFLLDENIIAVAIDIRTPLVQIKKRIEKLIQEKRKIGTKKDALSKENIDKLQYKYRDSQNKWEYGDNILHYIDYRLLTSLGLKYKQINIADDMFEDCKDMNNDSRVAKVKTTVSEKFKKIIDKKYAYRLLDFLENQKKYKSVTKKNKGR
ncbi:MAG: hypothetical protein J5896_03275 [Alphaproteobacteria bacterium]|nr:hypothetical protein [Alphaproteobacteria bacterium]